MRFWRWSIFSSLAGMLCGLAPGAEPVVERPFRIGGTMEVAWGSTNHFQNLDFEVSVSGRKWRIVTAAPGNSGVMRNVLGSEDTGEMCLLAVSPRGTNTGLAQIIPGRVPAGVGGGALQVAWLAFASSAWLRGAGTDRVTPVWSENARTDAGLKVIGRWELDTNAPWLPRTMTFFNDGTSRIWLGAEQRMLVQTNGWPIQWGYTNALLTTAGTLTAGGMEFPEGFSFLEFRHQGYKSSNELRVFKIARGTVTNVLVGVEPATFLPGLPGKAHVEDFRIPLAAATVKGTISATGGKAGGVSGAKHARYDVVDGKWPGRAEALWWQVRWPRVRRIGWWVAVVAVSGGAWWGLWRAARRLRAKRAAEVSAAGKGEE